ncbi:MAG: class I SAM-dependent rRNA methyltransferase, partial [Nannocystaceae bacterium]
GGRSYGGDNRGGGGRSYGGDNRGGRFGGEQRGGDRGGRFGGDSRGGDRGPRFADNRGEERGRYRDTPDREQPKDGEPRGNRRPAASSRPTVRRATVKVPDNVARLVRAGHPWIFRATVRRSLEELPTDRPVPVIDDSGYSIGWGLVEPEGAIGVRMISSEETLQWDAEEIERRVRTANQLREATGSLNNACRLIHGEADGFPGLAVDRLGEFLLIYKYSRVAETYIDDLVPVLASVFEPAGIYMQDRVRPVKAGDRRPPAFHLHGKTAAGEFTVDEDGLSFFVDVTAPVSPGLFLDLREGRRMCEAWSKGRRVLNLFSFTGAFGLRALRGGATTVTNVDAAARSHAKCRQNLVASELDPEACEALTGDVFKHLEKMRQKERLFDLVVVDPPPFSNVKGSLFSALKDWNHLMSAIAPVVAPGGFVLAVCNAARLTTPEFLLALGEGARVAGRTARVVAECGLGTDFPVLPAFTEGHYLKTRMLQLV